MLPDSHIFVKLTRKYYDIYKIADKITEIFNEKNIVSEYTHEAMSYLIKDGGSEIIYSNFIPTYAPCSLCSETPLHLHSGINDEVVHIVGITIQHKTPDNYWFTNAHIYIWEDCLNIINEVFNTIVAKLGRKKFKRLYYGLFIFKYYANITFDIYNKIGEQLFQLLCYIEKKKENAL